ncbi:MAG: ComEA family DNA-binding protein [Candidatus Acidiferrales bacterium]
MRFFAQRGMVVRVAAVGLLLVFVGLHNVSLAGMGQKQKPGLVNINTATLAELKELPGIGKAIAGRIIRHREKHGRFRKVEELLVIRGISRRRFEELRLLVTIGEAKQTKDAEEKGKER